MNATLMVDDKSNFFAETGLIRG